MPVCFEESPRLEGESRNPGRGHADKANAWFFYDAHDQRGHDIGYFTTSESTMWPSSLCGKKTPRRVRLESFEAVDSLPIESANVANRARECCRRRKRRAQVRMRSGRGSCCVRRRSHVEADELLAIRHTNVEENA